MSLNSNSTQIPVTVGQQLPASPWFVVDQQRINHFADITQDHQFIHIDPERAKDSAFGSTIAHGFLSLSLLTTLSDGCIPAPEGLVMAINYGFNKVRFINPVRCDDEIRFCASVVNIEEQDNNQYLQTLAVTVEIKGEEKPALVCEWLSLFVCEAED